MAGSEEKEDNSLSGQDKKFYKNEDGKYQAENDVRCLMDCAEIKKDKPRYDAAMYCMKKKREAMKEAMTEMSEGE